MEQFDLKLIKSGDKDLQEVLCNLTKMYCYEWSQYTGMDVDEKGCYVFEKCLPTYWKNPDRKAFLLCRTVSAEEFHWAGFALMDKDFVLHPEYDYSMAEFFVMFKYRQCGAGNWMAKTLFTRYPGKWEVGRNPKNISSVHFWDKVIDEYTDGRYELVLSSPSHRYADGTFGDVFSFDNSVQF